MIKNYVKKTVTVKAVEWTGKNLDEIMEFTGGAEMLVKDKELVIQIIGVVFRPVIGNYLVWDTNGKFCIYNSKQFLASHEEEIRVETNVMLALEHIEEAARGIRSKEFVDDEMKIIRKALAATRKQFSSMDYGGGPFNSFGQECPEPEPDIVVGHDGVARNFLDGLLARRTHYYSEDTVREMVRAEARK